MKTRRILAGVVGAAMALTMAGAAFAAVTPVTYLHQDGGADGIIEPGDAVQDCTGAPALDPGEIAWHFILNQTDGSFVAQGHFDFTVDAFDTEQASEAHGSGRDWYVVTGQTNLNGGTDTWTDGATTGEFNLSHVCQAAEATPTLPNETPTSTLPTNETPTPTLPQTNTIDQNTGSGPGTSLTLVFALILAVAGGLVAYAMRPRRVTNR